MMKLLLTLAVLAIGISVGIAQNTTDNSTTMSDVTTEPATTQSPTTLTTTKATPSSSLANITIPKNDPNNTCLKLQFDLTMNIKYSAQSNGVAFNTSKDIKFPANYDYDGECKAILDTVVITFFDSWSLSMNYTLNGSKYDLSGISLTYTITSDRFENASIDVVNKTFTAAKMDLHLFEGNKDNAYKCNSKTSVNVNADVTFDLSNYLGQPFYNKKDGAFDTAIDCPADTTGTSKLVPIIVGAALAFLVVLVLIAYLIGRRRHRSGYQSV